MNCLYGVASDTVRHQGRDIDTMAVISFASTKGGAGKTTACIVLGTEVARHGAHVTMIDADPAGRLVDWAEKGSLPPNISVSQCIKLDQLSDTVRDAQERSALVLIDLEGIASRLNSAAIARSNLVIIPMGDEQQDAKAAIETLSEIKLDEATLGRPIKSRVLFSRTKAAVKSGFARDINKSMRSNVPCFKVELHDRTAYSKLHNTGGDLYGLNTESSGRLASARENAAAYTQEVFAVLNSEEGNDHE